MDFVIIKQQSDLNPFREIFIVFVLYLVYIVN